jgi:hypothetical protein
MASLASLQGAGGGRIPMGRFSSDVSRRDLATMIESMPLEACRAMHIAARQGDTTTAQRLLREAAATYFITAPAAPAATVALRHRVRRPHCVPDTAVRFID